MGVTWCNICNKICNKKHLLCYTFFPIKWGFECICNNCNVFLKFKIINENTYYLGTKKGPTLICGDPLQCLKMID